MFSLFETLIKVAAVGFISLLVAANIISPNKTNTYVKEDLKIATTTPLNIILSTSTEEKIVEISQSSSTPEIKTITKIEKTTKIPSPNTPNKTNDPIKETLAPIEEKLNLSIKQIAETPQVIPNANEVNVLVRKAAVNILCYTEAGSILRPLTGSGIIIDERGVILTNAHLAQYFLLKDFPTPNNIDCIIRTGSPATITYRGELLYISPPWVEENKKNIIEENPLGTGEHDFGLILITSSANKDIPLPVTFPFIPFNTEEPNEKMALSDSYVVVAYPAGFLGGLTVLQNLYISSTVSSIKQFFTFKDTTLDLMSLGGSILAQKGSSGGAVVNVREKKVVGIIVTTTTEGTTSARDMRAITLSHINRSIQAVTNQGLSEYLSDNLVKKVLDFRLSKFDYLKNILVGELTHN
ncbi:MAG: serine protease [Patescibacteria group bacterium]